MSTPTVIGTVQASIRCHACSGYYALLRDDDGAPCCSHTHPACAAYTAIATIVDACDFAEACRKAVEARGS